MSLLIVKNARVVTPLGNEALHGRDMHNGVACPGLRDIVCRDGRIEEIVEAGTAAPAARGRTIDAGGRLLVPGFIDSHTHLIFAGDRSHEFVERVQGVPYMDIMRRGGGIQVTVDATRAATAEELAARAMPWLHKMAAMGVTTVEAKSGYALTTEGELKMLDAIALLQADAQCPVDLVATFMGAHAVPREYKGRTGEYVDMMIAEMLPAARGKARFCDIFCEKDVFELDDTRRLLEAARREGFGLKLHADEIVTLGGAELAAELGAVSADHLLHISPQGIEALAASPTVATCLPLTAFVLREPYAPARRMIDAGCAVALATDFNPGSCFSCSIPLMTALAGLYMKMTPEETLTALTLNAAAALGLAADRGSIEPGKRAHFALLDAPSLDFIHYNTGINQVCQTIRG